MLVVETVIELLLPSWEEVQVSVVAAAFVVVAFWFFTVDGGDDRTLVDSSSGSADVNDEKEEMVQFKGDRQTNSEYLVKVELLAAKNLTAANLNGTSDPYAIIACGAKMHFSSMVPGSRNPIWREGFNFSVDELPVEQSNVISLVSRVSLERGLLACLGEIVSWQGHSQNMTYGCFLGSVTISVEHEGQTGAIWYKLDNASGQICLHIETLKLQMDLSRDTKINWRKREQGIEEIQRVGVTVQLSTSRRLPLDRLNVSRLGFSDAEVSVGTRDLNGDAGANTRRRALDKQGPMVLDQKHGPLQTMFNLPPDEAQFSTYILKMLVIIPFGDIDEIRRSQHALINPAITIILRAGAGGHGVPPLGNADGRVRYKFASFWNRNHALRALQYAAKNYSPMLEAEKKILDKFICLFRKEREHSTLIDFIKKKEQLGLVDFVKEKQSALHAQSSSVKSSESQSEISEETVAKPEKFQPFIKEEVLTRIYNDVFPCTVEQFFKFILDDGSTFTSEYHTARKDSNLIVGQWHASDEYNGQVREVTYRTLCNFPLCPPDIPVTEWQHAVLSADKKTLVFEIIQQTEGVPFASYFEGHCRWSVETNPDSSCTVDIGFGAYFKKWCLLQSRIKVAATDDNKKVYKIKLDAARSYIKSRISNGEIGNTASSPVVIQESK
ncbi:hypothetical protein DH2020_047631 [Rehmannia glutinosa]|uniref:BAG-associated GRAM protein 1 n=1 Tax=Rehmannia glutinosa TaxID=99300 RepID=A0ABR0U831_REHGL